MLDSNFVFFKLLSETSRTSGPPHLEALKILTPTDGLTDWTRLSELQATLTGVRP